ncbi:hypothetical protein GJ496_011479 [Pomphorhynchus laevis]|nr:hypothetical protein GJ496_011479 [Pomphorhynchus laevis]
MEYILEKVPSGTANAIKFASEHRPPVWLSSIPLSVDKFHLTGIGVRHSRYIQKCLNLCSCNLTIYIIPILRTVA